MISKDLYRKLINTAFGRTFYRFAIAVGLKQIALKLLTRMRQALFRKKMVLDLKPIGGHVIKLELNPANGLVDRHIYFEGSWEKETSNLLLRLLNKGDTIIDIGANIGYYSVLLGKKVGSSGRVISFEPQQKIFKTLINNISLNNLEDVISAYQLGCGNCNRDLPIRTVDDNSGAAWIDESIGLNSDKVSNTNFVRVVKLDDFLPKILGNRKVHFMKIDAEGFEPEIIKGARNIITKHMPGLCFEFSPGILHRNGRDWQVELGNILEYLLDLGYSIKEIPNGKTVNSVHSYMNSLTLSSQKNLIAVQDV